MNSFVSLVVDEAPLDLAGLPYYRVSLSAWGNGAGTGPRPAICWMSNIQSLRPRDSLCLKLRQRIRNHSKLGALPALPSCPNRSPSFAAPTASKVPISKSCPPLLVETGTSVRSAVMSYFRTIRRSSVPARSVLSSTIPQRDLTGTSSPSYDASRTSNSIRTSSLALTPAFPGGLIPKSVCFTMVSPV